MFSPHQMGRRVVLAPLSVRLSVRPFVFLFVRHALVSALYFSMPAFRVRSVSLKGR